MDKDKGYIKYAYPGLVSYILFIGTAVFVMIKSIIRFKSALCKLMLVATVCYFVNLWWLDALQTLKYEYIMIALCFAFVLQKKDERKRTDAVL